jgi:hypothetical protein
MSVQSSVYCKCCAMSVQSSVYCKCCAISVQSLVYCKCCAISVQSLVYCKCCPMSVQSSVYCKCCAMSVQSSVYCKCCAMSVQSSVYCKCCAMSVQCWAAGYMSEKWWFDSRQGQEIYRFLNAYYRLWGPRSLLLKGEQSGQSAKLTTHPSIVRSTEIKNMCAYLLLPPPPPPGPGMLSWRSQGQLYVRLQVNVRTCLLI